MNAIQSMSDSLENMYEDLYSVHMDLTKKYNNHVKGKGIEDFDDNHKNLVNAMGQIANATLGIFRNYKIQKQLDDIVKIIDRLPDEVKRKYFAIELTE